MFDPLGVVCSAETWAGKIGLGSPYWVIDEVDLPGGAVSEDNDYFFNAWEEVVGTVQVNMPRARDIHMDRIRRVRDVELAKADTNIERALDINNGQEVARLRAFRSSLRNIPQTFDLSAFTTPELLKMAWPSELPRRN